MYRILQIMLQGTVSYCVYRRGSMELVTTRGPGSVVGDISVDAKPAPSQSSVVAKGSVTVVVIRHDKAAKYRNQPSVMAALTRGQNAQLVQEAMERMVECEAEMVVSDLIRRCGAGRGGGQVINSAPLSVHVHASMFKRVHM